MRQLDPIWWLFIVGMLIWALIWGAWFAWSATGGFVSHISCYVLGYVYATPPEPATFVRADSCEGVRHDVSQGMLVLHSPREWVAVVLPIRGGNQRFSYRWGAPSATIDGVEWPVAYGPVGKG